MNSHGATTGDPVSQTGLIFEADPFLMRLMVRVFRRRFSVVGHTDWKEAREDWRDFQFVIADITMMNSDSLHLISDLSRSGFRRPLIFLTGTHISDRLSEQLAADGIAFIEKPFAPMDLLSLVSALVVGRPTGRHHQDSQGQLQANPRLSRSAGG